VGTVTWSSLTWAMTVGTHHVLRCSTGRPQFFLVRDSLGKIEYAPCPNRALIWSPALPWTPGSPCFDG
jgi:hypothetical protein